MAIFLADEQDLEVDGDALVALAGHVLREQRVPDDMELSLLLVAPATIAELNARHLHKAGPTDVLAFPMDEPGESAPDGPAILGDVVLCPQVAHEQAAEHSRTFDDEIRLLIVHGILHLLGMDHADQASEHEMFGLTERLLESFAARSAP